MRLALLLLLLPAPAMHAQTQAPAPIERHEAAALPNAPQPTPTQSTPAPGQLQADKQWERLMRQTHYLRPEVRIQAEGDPIRCDVDKVTPDEIFCTQHRADNGPLGSLLRPKELYHVPRREIRDVREGGREFSTLLGLGIGIGAGVGVGSINQSTRADGGQAICALFFGGLGAVIGHALPLAGRPVYQKP